MTPEIQAELRRLLDAGTPVPWAQGDPAFGGRNAQYVVSISSEAMGRDVMGPMLLQQAADRLDRCARVCWRQQHPEGEDTCS